jgi:hypothetical protein
MANVLRGVVKAYQDWDYLDVDEEVSGEQVDVSIFAVVGEFAGKEFAHDIPEGSKIEWDADWEPTYQLKQ